LQDQAIKGEQIASKAGLDTQKIIDSLPQRGLVAEKSEDGSYKRNPDGTLATRNLTTEELKDNPVLAEKYAENQAKMNFQVAQSQSTMVRARVAQMKEQRMREETAQAQQPGAIQNWAKLVSDPASGVTLAQVPSKARGEVVNAVAQGGMKIAKPLTGDEIKRADLAANAVSNIEGAQAILDRRPDMFGPSGWGKTKFEKALAGGDPDAIDFQTKITLANLPAVGIHGVRGKWATEDLSKLDGNLYLNPESMKAVLGDISKSANEFKQSGGRQNMPSSTKTPENHDDPLGILK
jgi:hypothetical protein